MISKIIMLLKSPPFLGIFLGCTWFNLTYLPTANFMFILGIAVFVDLITGIAKAWTKGENTTSSGLRKTITKLIQYGGFIIVGVLLLNITIGDSNLARYRTVIDGCFLFMILIELISICENVVEVSPDSKIVRYVINPFMKLIKGRMGIKNEKKEESDSKQ